jgi:tol-pal system protein YbgF
MVPHRTFLPLAMALLAAALLVPSAAYSQDTNTQERLDRLERDLNMLQRQVYRGAPSAPGAPPQGNPNSAVSIEIRMEQLEAQMRDLTGRVEQVANGLDQLKQRVEQINSDFDVRFSQMSGQPTPGPSTSSRNSPGEPTRVVAGAPPTLLFPPGTAVPPPATGTAPIFGTLTPPGTAPARQPPPSAPEPASTEPALPSGSADHQFNYAYGMVKQGDYAGAETAFKAFIEAHPSDPLAASAQYWIGQTYYRRNKFMEAAAAFAEGYKRYPKDAKAAEDLLFMSMALAKADQKHNACLALAQLDQAFPTSPIRERASAERKRIGCT